VVGRLLDGGGAYSLALTAHRAFAGRAVDFKILATDIDDEVLEHARSGKYEADGVGRLPRFARRHFADSGDGLVKLGDEIRAMVSFKQLNLVDEPWPMRGPFSAIFCRNVLIYFDAPGQARVIDRLVPYLGEPGILCLGHADALTSGVRGLTRGPVPTSHCTPGFSA
jgi:chemotaxis protein methyltransferase CheR